MRTRTVSSTWLESEECRLNAKPYFSGAIEARLALQKFSCEDLVHLSEGGKRGIFNGPRFGRVYVSDSSLGLRLISGADMLQSDLSGTDLIAKWQARAMPEMILKEGTSLISSYGTIGRCVYTRKDMVGHVGSDNVLKIIPDSNKILPGYLYCFLSSKFGVPQVIKGEGGSVVTYLDPSRVLNIRIPRLGKVEDRAHALIQTAADLRVEANQELDAITKGLEEEIGGGPVIWDHRHVQAHAIQTVPISSTFNRLDAFHYIGYVGEAIQKTAVPLTEVGNYARALRPPILKRIKVDGTGIDFLNGRELLKLDQSAEDQIALRTPNLELFIVKPGMVLFQCVGQRYGIFGTPVLANRRLIGRAVTEAVMRLIPYDPQDAGYIFTYLATGFGRRLGMRHSAGTSIPVLQEDGASKILIYWPDQARRLQIHTAATAAWEKRARATELEDEARTLIERTIEDGGH